MNTRRNAGRISLGEIIFILAILGIFATIIAGPSIIEKKQQQAAAEQLELDTKTVDAIIESITEMDSREIRCVKLSDTDSIHISFYQDLEGTHEWNKTKEIVVSVSAFRLLKEKLEFKSWMCIIGLDSEETEKAWIFTAPTNDIGI